MKQIHIRRFLSLAGGADSMGRRRHRRERFCRRSPPAAAAGQPPAPAGARWELGDFFGLDSLSAVTVMTLAQSPLPLAGRSTVAALLSAGVTRDPPEPGGPGVAGYALLRSFLPHRRPDLCRQRCPLPKPPLLPPPRGTPWSTAYI